FEGTTEWINDDNLPVPVPYFYWRYDGMSLETNFLELEFTPGQERIICFNNQIGIIKDPEGDNTEGTNCTVCKTITAPVPQQIEIMPTVSKICDNNEPITFSSSGITESVIIQ